MGDLEKFLDFLYETQSGYVYAATKHIKNAAWDQKFYQWPRERDSLIAFIKTSTFENDVYVGPALYKTKVGDKTSFKSSNVAWVEFDGQSAIDFRGVPKPDMIVQTSFPSHQHCYWKIENLESIAALEDINRRLTYYMEADGSGWDGTQVLRPPETINHQINKSNKPLPVTLHSFNPPIFKHDGSIFDSAPEVEHTVAIISLSDLPQVAEVIEKHKLSAELTRRILAEITLEPRTRSTFMMNTGYQLAEAGLEPNEIIACLIAVDDRLKKFVGRHDRLLRLSEIASIASLKVDKDNFVGVYSPLDIVNHELDLDFIIDGWFHRHGIMIVSGEPGVGKTQFCIDLSYRLSTGSSVLGKPEYSPLRVGFLSLEMDVLELKYVYGHQYEAFKLDEEKMTLFNENAFITAPDLDATFTTFERVIKDNKPDVLIIDSLSELAQDDLKESEARRIMGWVRRVVREYQCGVILIHHNRKATEGNKKPNKLSDLYGSYIFGKLSETVISLFRPEGKELIDLDILKARFGAKGTFGYLKRTPALTFELAEKEEREKFSVTITDNNPLIPREIKSGSTDLSIGT